MRCSEHTYGSDNFRVIPLDVAILSTGIHCPFKFVGRPSGCIHCPSGCLIIAVDESGRFLNMIFFMFWFFSSRAASKSTSPLLKYMVQETRENSYTPFFQFALSSMSGCSEGGTAVKGGAGVGGVGVGDFVGEIVGEFVGNFVGALLRVGYVVGYVVGNGVG